MFPIFLKYLTLIICSLYTYIKIMNISILKDGKRKYVLFSVSIAIIISILRQFILPGRIIILIGIFTLYTKYIFQAPIRKSLIASILSFGLSYAAQATVGIFVSALMFPPLDTIKSLTHSDEIVTITILIAQSVLVLTLLQIKHLRRSLSFLLECGSSDIGVYISVSLLLAFSLFGITETAQLIYIIPMLFILLCSFFLYFWWRGRATKEYMNRLKAKEIEEMQRTLLQKDEKIAGLQCENEALAKIIHRDNKLIPAMELLVREFLLSAKATTDTQVLSARADEILLQLADASKERAGIIQNYELQNKKLPATNVPSVDALLAYMLQRSIAGKIDLEVSIEGSFRHLIDQELSELELNTLLSDLIENAMIAVGGCERKSVLICIGVIGGTYFIDIYDSGPPFQPEVLQKIGQEPITTHAESGGSGIGLMTTVGLCRKNLISLEIEEFSDQTLYTKRVRLCFDHLGQIRVPSDSGSTTK